MSEDYGACGLCGGRGKVKDPILCILDTCPRCDGTGKSGDATDYSTRELKKHPID